MNVVTIESETFQQMQSMVSTILNKVELLSAENKRLAEDRVMSVEEAMKYMNVGKTWLLQNKAEIDFIQIGCGPIKFRKSKIDAFLAKHEKGTKFKK